MLPMPIVQFLLSLAFTLSGHQAQVESNMVRVTAHVVEQKYCQGDADAFTVSLRLDVEIESLAKAPVYVLWPEAPWVGKVAANAEDARVGRFLYEQTASRYPQSQTHFERLKLEPGKKVSKRSEYYLVGRHNAASSLPKSVSAGTYAVVLVLSPEAEPPGEMAGPGTIKSLTTEPFLVEVRADPKLARCETAGPKGH